jgi:4-cresol dehydrogenase (hydroxylating)
MHEALSSEALGDLRRVLGDDAVDVRVEEIAAAERATFQTSQRIPVILRPRDRDQVSEAMRIANRHRFAVYPVSSGKNWGYGSRVPVVTGCALLDLSRLNRISDFNEKLGYVTVEPGVTQRALYRFLQEKNSKLWMDATGSSPDCSLIGNAMERGFGHTPYSDHFANVCGLEVVLPNGEVVETGFAGLPGAKTGPVYKWGMGPSIDSIFSQSSLGIVTRATVWLMPAPSYFQAFFFQCAEDESLPIVIDALRPLRLDGTLRSAIHIGNDYKVLSGIQQFPWGEEMPISRARMNEFQNTLKFTRWSGSGALYGTRKQVAESRRLLRQALRGKVTRLRFMDDRTLRLASRFTRPYQMVTGLDLRRTLNLLRPVYGLLRGVPTTETLGSAYWRKRTPVPPDPQPDRDGCGLLWCAPVAQTDGREATTLVGIAERTLLAHGFEPIISLTLLTERTLAAVISISYDREIPGEDEKAMACYRELEKGLRAGGFYSYRLGIASMEIQASRDSYSRLLAAIKQAVDPNSVLAPGRYIYEPTAEKELVR